MSTEQASRRSEERTPEQIEEATLVADHLLVAVEVPETHLDDLRSAQRRLHTLVVQMSTALRLGQPIDDIQRKIRLLRPSLTGSAEHYRREALSLLEHLDSLVGAPTPNQAQHAERAAALVATWDPRQRAVVFCCLVAQFHNFHAPMWNLDGEDVSAAEALAAQIEAEGTFRTDDALRIVLDSLLVLVADIDHPDHTLEREAAGLAILSAMEPEFGAVFAPAHSTAKP